MLQPNNQLGAYRIIRFIGAGGMGAVYEVEHTAMGTRHALKVLADHYLHSEGVRERFRREARIMFRLGEHPNIARATDLIDQPETLALVMDFVDGGDLAQALAARPGPLPWSQAWSVLRPVVEAVAHAHASGVVHRDLKPENVLLRRVGPWPGMPLVADFGIAKLLTTDSRTRTQTRMGTSGYAAPEQFRNAKDVGAEADVWALAMLAWRLVTGREPIDFEDNLALLKLYEGHVPVARLDGVSDEVADAVAAGLQVDPKLRPRDAGVLLRLLTVVAQEAAKPAVAPQPPPPQARRSAALGPWLFAGLALVAGAVLYVATRSPVAPVREEPAPVVAEEAPAAPAAPVERAEVLAPAPAPEALAPTGYVPIAPGEFWMGSPAEEEGRDSDEVRHQVKITRGYWLKETEVTQGEWRAVMGSNPSGFSGCGDSCPVEQVSWEDAVAYCNKLSEAAGLQQCYSGAQFSGLGCTGYRLPTEAEWEYAARAGTTGARYDGLDSVAWHDGNSGGRTHPVRGKAPNAWGLYDMLGNVWEWTNDWSAAYGVETAVDPEGPSAGRDRVNRGGGWRNDARFVRAAYRFGFVPAGRFYDLGFRPARSVP